MEGLMQHWPLVVPRIIDYAAKFHGEQEVVTRSVEGPIVSCTYKDIQQRSKLCALALKSLGMRDGDRVGTLAWNTARHIEAWYGIMGINGVCHTLNPRLFAADLTYIINHAEDSIILLDLTFVDMLSEFADKLPTVKHFVVMTDAEHMPKKSALRNMLCYETLLQAEPGNLETFQWTAKDENAACGLCYTSGTTGNPKGVLYSHRSNFLHTLTVVQRDSMDIGAQSTVLAVVPMFHANSWGLTFAAPMIGAKLVMPGALLDGANLYRLLDAQRVTTSAGVPTVWLGLLDYMQRHRLRLPYLKLMVVGGAAAPRSMIQTFQDEYKVEVKHLWGMTELSPCGTHGALKEAQAKLDKEAQLDIQQKQGIAHLMCDMRIVDDAGRELPWDGRTFGDLQVRGPIVMSKYFRHNTVSDVGPDGWFTTGDVATISPEGYMQITDRSKDVIKSGGEWISSIEIENVAVSHPKVKEAAVIAMADKKWSERPLLCVVAAEGEKPPKEEILRFLEGKIAKWWIPDDVVFVAEIPHTATGKISKKTLREQFKDYQPQLSRL